MHILASADVSDDASSPQSKAKLQILGGSNWRHRLFILPRHRRTCVPHVSAGALSTCASLAATRLRAREVRASQSGGGGIFNVKV